MSRARWMGVVGVVALVASGSAALAKEQPKPGEQQAVTDDRQNFGSAVSSPAEDLNIRRTEIPDVLVRATGNPYDMRNMDRCANLAAELGRLDAALGPDSDRPPPADTRSKNQKRSNGAASVLRTGVEAVTPYRGVIRRITGATAAQKKLQIAIESGFARRGFLKGLGMRLNCAPPAAPAWFKPEATRAGLPVARPATPLPVRRPVRPAH